MNCSMEHYVNQALIAQIHYNIAALLIITNTSKSSTVIQSEVSILHTFSWGFMRYTITDTKKVIASPVVESLSEVYI